MVGSDLDGTVREPVPFLGWMRDRCPIGVLRVVGGVLAAATATRVNPGIRADFYITGSPKCEERVTEIWLAAHGMLDGRHRVISDSGRSRLTQLDGERSSRWVKERWINMLGLQMFYEDDLDVARYLADKTEATIINV